jgi:hypothetical protein
VTAPLEALELAAKRAQADEAAKSRIRSDRAADSQKKAAALNAVAAKLEAERDPKLRAELKAEKLRLADVVELATLNLQDADRDHDAAQSAARIAQAEVNAERNRIEHAAEADTAHAAIARSAESYKTHLQANDTVAQIAMRWRSTGYAQEADALVRVHRDVLVAAEPPVVLPTHTFTGLHSHQFAAR